MIGERDNPLHSRRICGNRLFSEYVRAYHEERKRLAATSNVKRQRLEQQLGQSEKSIDW